MQRDIRIQVPEYVGELLLRHDGELQHGIVIGLSEKVSIKIHSNLPSPKADDFHMRGSIRRRNSHINLDSSKIHHCMKVSRPSGEKDFPV